MRSNITKKDSKILLVKKADAANLSLVNLKAVIALTDPGENKFGDDSAHQVYPVRLNTLASPAPPDVFKTTYRPSKPVAVDGKGNVDLVIEPETLPSGATPIAVADYQVTVDSSATIESLKTDTNATAPGLDKLKGRFTVAANQFRRIELGGVKKDTDVTLTIVARDSDGDAIPGQSQTLRVKFEEK